MAGYANRLLRLFAPVVGERVQPTVIAPQADPEAQLRAHDRQRRDRTARGYARLEARRALEALQARGLPVTRATAEGLAEIAINTYLDVMGDQR